MKKSQAVNKVDLRRIKDNVHSNAIRMQCALRKRSLLNEVAMLICLGCCKFSIESCFVSVNVFGVLLKNIQGFVNRN